MKNTRFILTVIFSLFAYSGYVSSSPVSKNTVAQFNDLASYPQTVPSEQQENQPIQDGVIQQSQASLWAIIMEQKKHIDQLEISKAKALKEVEELSSNQNQGGFNYSAWVSILLASIGVLVTVVGVMIALISFVGYKNFKASTKEAAEKISEDTASIVAREEVKNKINEVAKLELARLIDSGELKEHLESAVDVIYRKNKVAGGIGFDKYPEIDEDDL